MVNLVSIYTEYTTNKHAIHDHIFLHPDRQEAIGNDDQVNQEEIAIR